MCPTSITRHKHWQMISAATDDQRGDGAASTLSRAQAAVGIRTSLVRAVAFLQVSVGSPASRCDFLRDLGPASAAERQPAQ
jgi:hypothetical protein